MTKRAEVPAPREETEQICLLRWAAYQAGKYPELELLYHTPNGGLRSRTEAARLRAAGVKAGVPDLCLPVPRKGFHGLYIELKRISGGRVSKEQREWLEALSEQGYKAIVCKGWEDATREIMDYLAGHPAGGTQNAAILRQKKPLGY